MTRRIIAIIVALFVALAGAVAVVAYANAADARAVSGQETTTVYIAKAQVPTGTRADAALGGKLIVPQTVVAKGVPAGALVSVDAANSSLVATSTIMPGEIVLASRFGTLPKVEQVSGVPAGKVAVTLNLPEPQRVAPLLVPGSHVVLYDTFNARDPRKADLTPDGAHLADDKPGVRVTRVLVDDALVIGVGDRQIGPAPTPAPTAGADQGGAAQGDAAKASGALVTVAVSPAQALTLVHGIQTGTLYAGLRGKGVTVDVAGSIDDHTVLGK